MSNRTIKSMITEDLGYCCEFAFFTLNKRTSQIADRLGVTTRAIKYHKAKVREGCEQCESKANCLAKKGAQVQAEMKAANAKEGKS